MTSTPNKYICACGDEATMVYVKTGKVVCGTCTIEVGQSMAPLGSGWDPPYDSAQREIDTSHMSMDSKGNITFHPDPRKFTKT